MLQICIILTLNYFVTSLFAILFTQAPTLLQLYIIEHKHSTKVVYNNSTFCHMGLHQLLSCAIVADKGPQAKMYYRYNFCTMSIYADEGPQTKMYYRFNFCTMSIYADEGPQAKMYYRYNFCTMSMLQLTCKLPIKTYDIPYPSTPCSPSVYQSTVCCSQTEAL